MRTYLVAASLIIMSLISCSRSGSTLDEYNLPLYSPEYASGFYITGAEGRESTVVTVTNPWQGADSVSTCLFISQIGRAHV